jgi:hypothetical protein
VVGHAVAGAVDGRHHSRGETGFQLVEAIAADQLAGDPGRQLALHLGRQRRAVSRLLAQVEVTGPLVAGRAPDGVGQIRPQLAGQPGQPQLAGVPSVGPHAAHPDPARRRTGHRSGIDHEHVPTPLGEMPGHPAADDPRPHHRVVHLHRPKRRARLGRECRPTVPRSRRTTTKVGCES